MESPLLTINEGGSCLNVFFSFITTAWQKVRGGAPKEWASILLHKMGGSKNIADSGFFFFLVFFFNKKSSSKWKYKLRL